MWKTKLRRNGAGGLHQAFRFHNGPDCDSQHAWGEGQMCRDCQERTINAAGEGHYRAAERIQMFDQILPLFF